MKALFTAFLADASGKLNGTVAARNKGGQYFRTRVTPINPNTARQSQQRGQISDVSKAYANVLTDAQRQGWVTYGQLAGALNVFGNKMILSGIAAYQKVNQIVLTAGGTRIDDAPISKAIDALTTLALAADSGPGTLTLTFTPTPYAGPAGLYLYATPAISAGISNFSSQLRFIGFVSGAASPLDITAEWSATFGTFPSSPGQRIGVTAQACDPDTGAITPPYNVATLVV